MGIRIASQPVGAPILAATSTAVAQANERRGAMQARMFQDKQRRKAIQDERQADREFQLQRDKTAADEAEKRRQADNAEFDRRDNAYRRKDALGAMYDEVARREKFYSSTPLTPEGMKQRDEAAASLRYIRERQAAGDRPEIIQQYMAQWIAEFDNRNPAAWEEKPRPTFDDFSKTNQFFDESGRPLDANDVREGRVKPSFVSSLGSSGWGKPQPLTAGKPTGTDAFPSTSGDFFADPKNFDWAYGRAMDEFASDLKNTTPPTQDQIERRMGELYEMRRRMAGAGAQPQQPQPTAGGGSPQPIPGDGQALPVPAAPYQPPAQPLNAGDVVLPGGPSQLAPPPRDYAAEVAATQAGLRTDASGRMLDANGNPVQVDPRDMQPVLRTDKDGRMVDAQGNRITTDVRDMQPVLRTDSQGRQVDAAGNPVQSAPSDMQAAQPRLNPDDAAALVQRARAMDPQNAQMYDKADALFKGKPREQWTEADITLFFEAYRRAWTAGLTQ